MIRVARPFSVAAVTVLAAATLACSGMQDAAMDAAVEAIESDPNARKEFEQSFRTAFVNSCKESAGGKAKKKMEDVCTCAADKVLADKSIKELFQWSKDLQKPDVQKEMRRIVKDCM